MKENKKLKVKKTKLKKRIKVESAIMHIKVSFNNTIVSLTSLNGDVFVQSSSGKIGYKGTKKSTPYAAQLATEAVLKSAKDYGVREIMIKVNGIGAGRNSVLRAVENSDLRVLSIADVTPLPHNGCRPPKKPRV